MAKHIVRLTHEHMMSNNSSSAYGTHWLVQIPGAYIPETATVRIFEYSPDPAHPGRTRLELQSYYTLQLQHLPDIGGFAISRLQHNGALYPWRFGTEFNSLGYIVRQVFAEISWED